MSQSIEREAVLLGKATAQEAASDATEALIRSQLAETQAAMVASRAEVTAVKRNLKLAVTEGQKHAGDLSAMNKKVGGGPRV